LTKVRTIEFDVDVPDHVGKAPVTPVIWNPETVRPVDGIDAIGIGAIMLLPLTMRIVG